MNDALFYLPHKSVLKISGVDRFDFLQGLITQDIFLLKKQSVIYTAFLNAKGRYLFDGFLSQHDDAFFFETNTRYLDSLIAHFAMYKLRRHVVWERLENVYVYAALPEMVPLLSTKNLDLILEDPRQQSSFVRILSFQDLKQDSQSKNMYEYWRIKKCLPEAENDFIRERSFPLESRFDDMNAMNFKKGCYLGQEPVSRTYYQGVIRKNLFSVSLTPCNIKNVPSLPAVGTIIYNEDGDPIGELRSSLFYANEWVGLALLRLEAIKTQKSFVCGEFSLDLFFGRDQQ